MRPAVSGGRWSLLGDGLGLASSPGGGRAGGDEGPGKDTYDTDLDPDELAEAVAGQLLSRWGVVFRDLFARESLAIAWRDVLWALRRLEARGVVLGGRHVAGFAGEQFALPEAVEQLRTVVKSPADGVTVQLSATDPLNLTGVILPGPRIPAQHARTITLKDGVLERPEVLENSAAHDGALPG